MQANKNSSVFEGQQHSLANFVWRQPDKEECHTCESTRESSLHSRPKKMRSTFFHAYEIRRCSSTYVYVHTKLSVGNIVAEAFVNSNASGKNLRNYQIIYLASGEHIWIIYGPRLQQSTILFRSDIVSFARSWMEEQNL